MTGFRGKEAAFTHAHAGFAPMDVVPCGNNGYPNRCNRFVGVSGNRVYPGRDGMRDWPWENLYMLQTQTSVILWILPRFALIIIFSTFDFYTSLLFF